MTEASKHIQANERLVIDEVAQPREVSAQARTFLEMMPELIGEAFPCDDNNGYFVCAVKMPGHHTDNTAEVCVPYQTRAATPSVVKGSHMCFTLGKTLEGYVRAFDACPMHIGQHRTLLPVVASPLACPAQAHICNGLLLQWPWENGAESWPADHTQCR